MLHSVDNSGLAIDANGLNGLKVSAKQNSPEALKGAAKQFEAMFLDMMVKSMRDATPQDGMMDSDQSRMFTSMLDQQMTQKMATRGMGLADALVRQLSGTAGKPGQKFALPASDATGDASGVGSSAATKRTQPPNIKAFQDKLAEHAEQASRATGVPAKFMLGQAALETGWGKREIKMADGSSSHNLFCIKASAGWKGKVVQAPTTEYINGVPQTRMEKFRAYDSYADAFHDYANLLRKNP
ncbi:MAG: flagellar assembly peptidoglycan hydrolase FlgJ, partial [Burkholderiaceae bacterium]|nr:flagellar assembly peptidoglycan hydrolase FlgJ [Burkholderiaceae bacterium]